LKSQRKSRSKRTLKSGEEDELFTLKREQEYAQVHLEKKKVEKYNLEERERPRAGSPLKREIKNTNRLTLKRTPMMRGNVKETRDMTSLQIEWW
jgi:hypothetical protein